MCKVSGQDALIRGHCCCWAYWTDATEDTTAPADFASCYAVAWCLGLGIASDKDSLRGNGEKQSRNAIWHFEWGGAIFLISTTLTLNWLAYLPINKSTYLC